MKQRKITGVKVGLDDYGHEYFIGFYIHHSGSVIEVDLDEINEEFFSELSADEQVDWARDQVGNYLNYETLVPCGWRAEGGLKISEQSS